MALRAAAESVTAVRRGAAPQDAVAAADLVRRQGAFPRVHPDVVARAVAAYLRVVPPVSVPPGLRQGAVRRELQGGLLLATRALQLLAAALLAPQVEQARRLARADELELQASARLAQVPPGEGRPVRRDAAHPVPLVSVVRKARSALLRLELPQLAEWLDAQREGCRELRGVVELPRPVQVVAEQRPARLVWEQP